VAKKNERIRAAMPKDVKDDPINVMFGTEVSSCLKGRQSSGTCLRTWCGPNQDGVDPRLPGGCISPKTGRKAHRYGFMSKFEVEQMVDQLLVELI
jgi:hypothetical protein